MRLLVFSDIHNDLGALRRLMAVEADHYVAAGDLVSWGRGLDTVGEILKTRAGQVHVLPGNHESQSEIAGLCRRYGLDALHGKSFEAGGCHIAGLGYSTPTPFDTPGEYSEDEIASRLSAFAGLAPLVLICHSPPLETPLDQAGPGRHHGSRAVREFIEREQPMWFFCGHIHEAEGRRADLKNTRAVNVGKAGFLAEIGA